MFSHRYHSACALALLSLVSLGAQARGVIAVSTDNDLFAPKNLDRDYTAGVAVTYASDSETFSRNQFSGLLGGIDTTVLPGFLAADSEAQATSVEFGVYGFTPDDIEVSGVIGDDRPYSSLTYLSTSRNYPGRMPSSYWTTALTVGALGLDVFEAGQNAIHPIVGSEKARGWDHQISQGGEPTFRYSAAYHQYLEAGKPDSKFKVTHFGSVGYLTEFGSALVFRDGLISSPDNRFNPELMAYGERGAGVSSSAGRESYFWGGVSVKLRAYNAFLQGQFRDSDHELDAGDLNILLAEVWAGYTHSLWNDFELSYVLRAQTSEIKSGQGDRTLVWGGLVLSKRFGSF